MKRTIRLSALSLVWTILFLLGGCKEPEVEITPIFPEKVTASVSAGQQFHFSVEPNMKWTMKIPTEVATYFKFIVGESERYTLNGEAGKHDITVAVAENEEFDNVRVCAIEMTMGDQTKVVAELTRGSKERTLEIYTALYDEEEDGFVSDEEGNWLYSSTPADKIEWVWSNEQWMQRIKVEANFTWSLAVDTPDWINASTTTGKDGVTEIFLRTTQEFLPLEDTTCELNFCDISDRNGDGIVNDDDILVVESYKTTIEGCKATCNVTISAQALFNAAGECYQASTDSYTEYMNGRIYSPRGAELLVANKIGDNLYSLDATDWMILSLDDFPAEAGQEGIWERTFTFDVTENSSTEARQGAIIALPLTVAGESSVNLADYVVCEVTQEGIVVEDYSEPITVYDENMMLAYGAQLEKLEKDTWPWKGAWASIPNAYKLTYRDNNSGDDLVFNFEVLRYQIYGYNGYSGSVYDTESCWLTFSPSDQSEAIEGGYIIKSRLDEEEYPNTMPGSRGQNEATLIFYNANNEPYALIYFVLDPEFSPYGDATGEVAFVNPEEAISKGARIEEIVRGDEEFSEEDDYMGVLQYRLTLTPSCKSVSINTPAYTMAYAYQSWLECEQVSDQESLVKCSSEESANGRITFYGSNNYNVVLQLIVVYKAE